MWNVSSKSVVEPLQSFTILIKWTCFVCCFYWDLVPMAAAPWFRSLCPWQLQEHSTVNCCNILFNTWLNLRFFFNKKVFLLNKHCNIKLFNGLLQVGDSVVSKARETLERAISLVGNNKQWGARVVYGDTDSMFVLVPGKSREEAFRIGAEIAEAVTNDNPQPVKLKLEKVYQPCLLQVFLHRTSYL